MIWSYLVVRIVFIMAAYHNCFEELLDNTTDFIVVSTFVSVILIINIIFEVKLIQGYMKLTNNENNENKKEN